MRNLLFLATMVGILLAIDAVKFAGIIVKRFGRKPRIKDKHLAEK